MSRFFKSIKNQQNTINSHSDDITSYLINEIEEIVAKKVHSSNYHTMDNANNYSNKSDRYTDGEQIERKRTPRLSKYIDNNYDDSDLLPFKAEEIKPNINDKKQIHAIIKQTLRPALNEWLDENLDEIINKALHSREEKVAPKNKRNSYYDYD
ncbi:DUF2497 domain-containing protein [Rickettsiales bacterium LUAb2]